jgi:hypothetical protein
MGINKAKLFGQKYRASYWNGRLGAYLQAPEANLPRDRRFL